VFFISVLYSTSIPGVIYRVGIVSSRGGLPSANALNQLTLTQEPVKECLEDIPWLVSPIHYWHQQTNRWVNLSMQ